MGVRDIKYHIPCPICQCERIVSYCQKYNIEKGICKKECKKCQISTGLMAKPIPPNNKKYYPRKNKYKSHYTLFYNQLFADDSMKLKMKVGQRNAKLGLRGEETNRWDGGKTSERRSAMGRDDYKSLKKIILARDNYTCAICKVRGVQLDMDHILEWCNYPNKRFDPENLRLLCRPCHKKTDNYAMRAIAKGRQLCLFA